MTDWKIGDTVRLIDIYGGVLRGDVGVVEGVEDNANSEDPHPLLTVYWWRVRKRIALYSFRVERLNRG